MIYLKLPKRVHTFTNKDKKKKKTGPVPLFIFAFVNMYNPHN